MIVSSLVVTLSPEPGLRDAALASLRGEPGLTLGDPIGARMPVVAETDSTQDGADLYDAIGAYPGVVRVDVVAIDFSMESTAETEVAT